MNHAELIDVLRAMGGLAVLVLAVAGVALWCRRADSA
jgi:hypothetical protein